MFDPSTVRSASDLPVPLPLVIETQGNLKLQARQPLAYSFHWLREVALGAIEGDLGLKLDAGGEVAASLTVNGAQRQVISIDDNGRLRLQVFKRRTGEFDFAAQVSVSAQASTPLPHQPDDLVAAVLGVHPEQWLKDIERLKQTAVETVQELAAKVPPDTASQLLSLWNTLASGQLAKTTQSLDAFQNLDGWVRQQLEALFGSIRSPEDIKRLLAGLRTLVGLRDSVYGKAVDALEKKQEAGLSYRYMSATEDTALVDCSFAFSQAGLAAFRMAFDGDYSWILTSSSDDTEVRQGLLTSNLATQATVELHMPYFDRKEWTTRLESLARMEVASDGDGRLLVYHVDASHRVQCRNSYQSVLALAGGLSVGRIHSTSSFTLAYSDQRKLPVARAPRLLASALEAYAFPPASSRWLETLAASRGGELNVSLGLSIPGSLATAWLDAPGERDPMFFAVYSRVSVAVQQTMRTWLPYIYFSDVEKYDTLDAAFPLVVYQVSRAFSGRPKYDFNYDVLSETCMSGFFRMAAPQLAKELARIEGLLLEAGKKSTASFYNPKQAREILASVMRKPRLLTSLLVADAFLVDTLVNLGCQGHELRETAAKDPAAAVRNLSRFAAEFVKAFHGKLRRLYGGQEFLALGGLLLVEATKALNGIGDGHAGIEAVLRISQGTPASPNALSQTLVNSAYLPANN